jgi:putative intracellular protease/amidase
MARVLVPLPDRGFDLTEVAVPWYLLTKDGHEVVFCTENGNGPPSADPLLIAGTLPRTLRARPQAHAFYRELEHHEAFHAPTSWHDIDPADFDGLVLAGGHAPETRQYLESSRLQEHVAQFFELDRPVGAICHGVLVAARSRDRSTGRSLLFDRTTTCLAKYQEQSGYLMTSWKLGRYYRTYPEYVADLVKGELRHPGQFKPGPLTLTARDGETDSTPAFVNVDGRYVSARWPGDAYTFTRTFEALLR